MRIAFVTGHYYPFAGGVESHVEQIATRLAERGDDVTILTQSDSSDWAPSELVRSVQVLRFPVPIPSRHLAVSPKLGTYLRRHRATWDVVHAHGYHSIAPLLAAISGASPLVFTPHYHGTGHSPLRKALHKPYRLAGRGILSRAKRVICVSKAERDLLVRHFPFVEDRTQIIPNGVDLEALQARQPAHLEGTVVLSAGRLERYKHVDQTIRAVEVLGSEFNLTITGDGPDRGRLQHLVDELGLHDRVRFVGRVDEPELHALYRRADVYVSMSTNEAMPVTILELLACGARVVASDIPAHRDIAARTNGEIAIIPTDARPAELAEAIAESAHLNPRKAEVPTWDEVADATRALYVELVNPHG